MNKFLMNFQGVDQISSPEECRLALRATQMLTDAVALFMQAVSTVAIIEALNGMEPIEPWF